MRPKIIPNGTTSRGVPEIVDVQTHLEPLAEPSAGTELDDDPAVIESLVREATGVAPRAVRFLHTDEGLVAYLTLAVDGPATDSLRAERRAAEVEDVLLLPSGESPDVHQAEGAVDEEPGVEAGVAVLVGGVGLVMPGKGVLEQRPGR